VASEHDRAACFRRQRDDARRALGAHHVRERLYLQTVAAVPFLAGAVVSQIGDAGIFSARHLPSRLAIPPLIAGDAMHVRKRARRDRGMAGARHGLQIWICGVAEPRALFDEALESAAPVALEPLDVIGAHLIDDQHHDQLWSGRLTVKH
jgi:hypothetical protein